MQNSVTGTWSASFECRVPSWNNVNHQGALHILTYSRTKYCELGRKVTRILRHFSFSTHVHFTVLLFYFIFSSRKCETYTHDWLIFFLLINLIAYNITYIIYVLCNCRKWTNNIFSNKIILPPYKISYINESWYNFMKQN